jgi:hypothetical protein
MASVTSITCIAGGPSVHVTVQDQVGAALPPENIAWETAAGVSITADGTGFMIAAEAATAAAALTTAATYTGPLASSPVVGPALTIDVVAGVTALEYASP